MKCQEVEAIDRHSWDCKRLVGWTVRERLMGIDKDVEEGSKSTRKIVIKNKLSIGFSEIIYKEGQKESWLIFF